MWMNEYYMDLSNAWRRCAHVGRGNGPGDKDCRTKNHDDGLIACELGGAKERRERERGLFATHRRCNYNHLQVEFIGSS